AETWTPYAPDSAGAPAPWRPSHATPRVPAANVRRASTRRTTPLVVSTVAVIVAARERTKGPASRVVPLALRSSTLGVTPRLASVSFSVNGRSAADTAPVSSVAVTAKRQLPSGSFAPSGPFPFQLKRYTPGWRGP